MEPERDLDILSTVFTRGIKAGESTLTGKCVPQWIGVEAAAIKVKNTCHIAHLLIS